MICLVGCRVSGMAAISPVLAGREPINLPVGRLARIHFFFFPIADVLLQSRETALCAPVCDIVNAGETHCRPLRCKSVCSPASQREMTEAQITPAGPHFADPLPFWQGLTGGGNSRS